MWIIENKEAYNPQMDIKVSMMVYNKEYSPESQWRENITIDFHDRYKLKIDETHMFFEELRKKYDLSILTIVRFVDSILKIDKQIMTKNDLNYLFENFLKNEEKK